MLRQGARGPSVAALQRRLAARGMALAADGMFGPATRGAVVAFQRSAGLSPDGVVGPMTWGALDRGAGGGAGAGPGAGGPAPGPAPARLASVRAKLQLAHKRMASLVASRRPSAPEGQPSTAPGPAAAPPAPRTGWMDDIGDAASDAWDTATDAAGDVVDTASDMASDAWDTATDVAEEAWDVAEDVGGETVSDIRDATAEAWKTAKEIAGEAADTASDVAGDAWDTAKDAASDAWDTAKEVADGVVDAGGEGYGGTGGGTGVDADGLKGQAEKVWKDVQDWGSDLADRYRDELDRLAKAARDLARPLSGDLAAVEQALDQLIADLDPAAGADALDANKDQVPDPEAGAYVFNVKQPPKRATTRLSAASLEKMKVATEAASKAQAGGGARFLYVQPAPFKPSGKKVDKKGRVLALTVETQETLGVPAWPEYDADPGAWHPMARKAWETAHQGMEVHEAEHVRRDQQCYTAEALQREVHGKPQGQVGAGLDAIEAAAVSESDSWDSNTEHGVMGTPSTVVRIPHFQEVEAWNKDHPEDKDKKM